MTSARSRIDDARRLASFVGCYRPGSVLDIGVGDGELLLAVASHADKPALIGLDVDGAALRLARRRLAASAPPPGVIQLILADATQDKMPRVDLACLNPPLLPGELGFVDTATGRLFWHTILERLDRERFAQTLLLHLFGFHGLSAPTGPFEPLQTVVQRYSLEAICLYEGLREVHATSRIRAGFTEIKEYFPLATMTSEGLAQSITHLPDQPTGPLTFEHYVVAVQPVVRTRTVTLAH